MSVNHPSSLIESVLISEISCCLAQYKNLHALWPRGRFVAWPSSEQLPSYHLKQKYYVQCDNLGIS